MNSIEAKERAEQTLGKSEIVSHVVIDTSHGNMDKFAHPWDKKSEWIGIVIEPRDPPEHCDRYLVKPCDDNDVADEEWNSEIAHCAWEDWMDSASLTICESHGEKIYHDKKEEWLCPFCDLP